MSAHAPALPLEIDPLIAEAKQRARRRRFLLASIVVVAAGAVGATFALRSTERTVGICATAPPGWKERRLWWNLHRPLVPPPTIVLTNFRFGRSAFNDGLVDYELRWPRDGVMLAVANEGPHATPPFGRVLRVAAADFRGFEGATWPTAEVAVRSQGRVLDAYVEARTVTPATIAAANRALAGVGTCSA